MELPSDFHVDVKGEKFPKEEHLFLGVVLEYLKEMGYDWSQRINFDDIAYSGTHRSSTICEQYFQFILSNNELNYCPDIAATRDGFITQVRIERIGEYYVTQKFIDGVEQYVSKK
ncbi:hypothetical protein A9Q91_01970 [Candidatus Gracilibacteria bacterium 28_42_T64]|nr:hypothetical protein A9Q91_01970 [Candidatus Gracilibacteria bacterium 28_42_T64]